MTGSVASPGEDVAAQKWVPVIDALVQVTTTLGADIQFGLELFPDGMDEANECAQNPTGAMFDSERAAGLEKVLDRFPQALWVEDDHAGPRRRRPGDLDHLLLGDAQLAHHLPWIEVDVKALQKLGGL